MTLDRHAAARTAARQHGPILTTQLLAHGASRSRISRMHRRGELHRISTGVWVYGHPRLSQRGAWSAARLSGGEGAVLVGHAAAAFWGIGRRKVRTVEIGVAGRRRRRLRGVRYVEVADIGERSVVEDGIRVLTVTWTIALLAAEVSKGELVRMIAQAAFRRILDIDELMSIAHDGSRRPGTPKLKSAIHAWLDGEHGTDSALEERVGAWLRDPQEDPIRRNVYLRLRDGEDDPRVDILYRRMRIVVEPGGPHHDSPFHRRKDRRRWARMRRAGFSVFPIRQEDFDRDPYEATREAREAISVGLERLRSEAERSA